MTVPLATTDSGHAAVYQRTNTGAASWTLIGDFYGDSTVPIILDNPSP